MLSYSISYLVYSSVSLYILNHLERLDQVASYAGLSAWKPAQNICLHHNHVLICRTDGPGFTEVEESEYHVQQINAVWQSSTR